MPITQKQLLANRKRTREYLIATGAMKELKNTRLPKPPVMLFPSNVEREYALYLRGLLEDLRRSVGVAMDELIPDALKEFNADAWTDPVEVLNNQLQLQIDRNVVGSRSIIEDIGQNTSDWNDKQWRKTLNSVLGIQKFTPEFWADSVNTNFVNTNTALIKDLESDTLKNVRREIVDGVTAGDSYKTIKKNIMGTDIDSGVFKKTSYRANLIARDQVGKLNGELTRRRQEDIGINRYTWQTSEDERVRGNPVGTTPNSKYDHFARNDKIYSYNKPPPDGNPGEPIQCRCYAEAVFQDLFGDSEIIKPEETKKTPVVTKVKPVKKKTGEAGPSKITDVVPKGYDPIQQDLDVTAGIIDEILSVDSVKVKNTLKNDFSKNYMSNASNDTKSVGKLWDSVDDEYYKRIMIETTKQYKLLPDLREQMRFYGSMNQQSKYLRDNLLLKYTSSSAYKDGVAFYAKIGVRDPEKKVLQNFKKSKAWRNTSVNGKTIAHSCGPKTVYGKDCPVKFYDFDMEGLSYNNSFFNKSKKVQKSHEASLKRGFSPKTIPVDKSVESIVVHEFGHEIDRLINLTNDSALTNKINVYCHQNKVGYKEAVSGYSAQGGKTELIAEAWSEYKLAPNPRELSTIIGEFIESKIKVFNQGG